MTDPLASLLSLPRDAAVIVEANPSLARALHSRGFHVVHVGERIPSVPSTPNAGDLNTAWSVLTGRTSAAAAIAGPTVTAVARQAVARADVNGTTSAYRARGWVANLVENLPYLTRSLAMQATGLEGVPAFIVGAGSSLDRNHHLIAECSKRGIVIGINAAARLPGVDVALTVECNDLRYKLGPLDHVGIRAFGMTAAPEVMRHGAGALLPVFAGELGGLLEHITGVPRLACSAMGGTAAVSLAELWGCDPIVLIGHDFAVGELVYPRCLGLGESRVRRDGDAVRYDWAPELRAQPRHNPLNEAEPAIDVPALKGGSVGTTFTLAGTRHWYESAAEGMPLRRLWNASEWGAAVIGWEPVGLAEALQRLPEVAYEVRAPDATAPETIAHWVEGQLQATGVIETVAHGVATSADPWPGLAELLLRLRAAPLVEPWCQASIVNLLATRRGEPMAANPWTERQASAEHARQLAAIVAAETPGLSSCLRQTRARLCVDLA